MYSQVKRKKNEMFPRTFPHFSITEWDELQQKTKKKQGGKAQGGGKTLENRVEERLIQEGGTVRCLNCWLWSHWLRSVASKPTPLLRKSLSHIFHLLSLLFGQASLSASLKCPSVSMCGPGGKGCNLFLKLQVAALFLLQTVPLKFGGMS